MCDLKGMRNKVLRRKKMSGKFYRTAKSTLKGIVKMKLAEKTNWFKKKKQETSSESGTSKVPGGRAEYKHNSRARRSGPSSAAGSASQQG